ncbi:MAG TPA: hypothetical protein VFV22_03120 [Candidatus Paceibacterota bacterium]|nr:hypothetical protein [Candidatus Paceibacterota bacterium]
MLLDQFRRNEHPLTFGKHNSIELVSMCPECFFEIDNPWSSFARILFYAGGRYDQWVWKNGEDVSQNIAVLRKIFTAPCFGEEGEEQMVCVAGWFLAGCLEYVPTYQRIPYFRAYEGEEISVI